MGLMSALGPGKVALDSAIFIYKIEQHPRFSRPLRDLFDAFETGHLEAVTSAISLLEVLVRPLRAGRKDLVEAYQKYLLQGPGMTLRGIDLPILRAAAALRASVHVRTPDALQLATALAAGCSTFLTNDRRIPAISGLRVLQLELVS